MSENEEFRPYMRNIEVSNLGNVRSVHLDYDGEIFYHEKTLVCNERGYLGGLYWDPNTRKNKFFYLHQAVCKCFIGERPLGYVIDHIDRNKLNNSLQNLRYVSQKQNRMNSNIFIIGSIRKNKNNTFTLDMKDKFNNRILEIFNSYEEADEYRKPFQHFSYEKIIV